MPKLFNINEKFIPTTLELNRKLYMILSGRETLGFEEVLKASDFMGTSLCMKLMKAVAKWCNVVRRQTERNP